MATAAATLPKTKGGAFLIEERTPDEIFTPEDLTAEHRDIARTADEFWRKEVEPNLEDILQHQPGVAVSILRKAAEIGLTGIMIPEKFGGMEMDLVSAMVVAEQISRDGSYSGWHGAHTGIGTLPILYFGTEEQKQRYLPRLAKAELIAAYALTEPHAGSDALAAKTRADLSADGKYYVLNGQKMWITNGGAADLFTVFAKVGGEKFTAFLVERGPGLVSGHEEKKLGIDGSSTTALMLEDCRVPAENVLGEVGRGHKIAFNVLNIGRLKLGARSVGTMKLSLLQSVNYAKERHQFGQAIANFGLIKHKLAEMTIRAYVGESILYRTVGMIDEALHSVDKDDPHQVLKVLEQYAIECSIIKVWESEALGYVVDEEVQVFGGYGYSRDYPAERAYRDARIARIYEGTNEINRIVIGSQLLRRAKSGELPLLKAATVAGGEITISNRAGTSQTLEETKLLAASKALALASIARADRAYGERARDEQEVLGLIAEMVMDVYAMESTLLRTERLIEEGGAARSATQLDIARVFARDAAGRIERAARAVEAETTEGEPSSDFGGGSQAVNPIKAIAARRRIADSTIAAGRYNLS